MVWQNQGQTAPEDVALSVATLLTHNSVREATIPIEQLADVLLVIWWRWWQTWSPDCLNWRHGDSFSHGQSSLDASYALFRIFGCLIEIRSLST
jgi:hypothetical protein